MPWLKTSNLKQYEFSMNWSDTGGNFWHIDGFYYFDHDRHMLDKDHPIRFKHVTQTIGDKVVKVDPINMPHALDMVLVKQIELRHNKEM